MSEWPKTGNMDDIYSATRDEEIDIDWAAIAKASRERWSKENSRRKKLNSFWWKIKAKWLGWRF